MSPRVQESREERVAKLKEWAAGIEADCEWVDDYSPVYSADRLQEDVLSPTELETKLGKLSARLKFIVNPGNPKMKAVYLDSVHDDNYLCAYHNSPMPRKSLRIMRRVEEIDPSCVDPHTGFPHITREMMEEAKRTGVKAGMKAYVRPGPEVIRGWSTVVVKCAKVGAITQSQAERTFPSLTDSRGWAHHIKGNSDSYQPW